MTTTTRSTALLLLGLLSIACGSANDRPPAQAETLGSAPSQGAPAPRASSELPPAGNDVATGECELGESRDCRVWLPEVNGVKNCFVGTQVCVTDAWSKCLSDDDAAEALTQSGL